MLRLNLFTAASFVVLLATGAQAADMPAYYEPEPIQEYGGWYLRGDIGASNQFVNDFSSPYWDQIAGGAFPDAVYLLQDDFDASFFIAAGFGYKINDMFRVDFTGEYRFESDFHGLDNYDTNFQTTPGIDGTNQYTGTKEEAVFLFNAYYDLPSWGIMTPYIGAGVGAAWIKLSDFTDYNPTFNATGLSGEVTEWNLAGAAYAGLAFEINDRLTFDVGYRFLYLGDISTENLLRPDGTDGDYNPFDFEGIASHDVKVGLRYMFN
jgi:opacity protein-like surface antigen